MVRILVAASLIAAAVSPALARTFTVKNNCPYTIWPAHFTDLNVAPNVPNHPTGWEQKAGASVSFFVPNNWKAGRLWARTDCDFNISAPPLQCSTGGCNGGLRCDPRTGTGVPPVTVAEWTFQGDGNQDFYDVSLVDGFNIPMKIDISPAQCADPACNVNLNPACPNELKHVVNGQVKGCKSACFANLDGNQANSPNCCSGQYGLPGTCPPSGVQFYDFFKSRCPTSYAYAYDESSETALWTCDSGLNPDYTITFCP